MLYAERSAQFAAWAFGGSGRVCGGGGNEIVFFCGKVGHGSIELDTGDSGGKFGSGEG